jgi:hypothetical protein
MTQLFEAYLEEEVDIPDMDAFLEARREIVNYEIVNDHWKFFFTRFIPEVAIHSKSQDERIVRDHYDRGDDFFEAFLGDRMVYTSGIFRNERQTLEQAIPSSAPSRCCKRRMRWPRTESWPCGAKALPSASNGPFTPPAFATASRGPAAEHGFITCTSQRKSAAPDRRRGDLARRQLGLPNIESYVLRIGRTADPVRSAGEECQRHRRRRSRRCCYG